MWFQLDGCPAHYNQNLRQHLGKQFPICVCSIFAYGLNKTTCFFQEKTTTRENMMERTCNAIRSLPRAEIKAAVFSTDIRLRWLMVFLENSIVPFNFFPNALSNEKKSNRLNGTRDIKM